MTKQKTTYTFNQIEPIQQQKNSFNHKLVIYLSVDREVF